MKIDFGSGLEGFDNDLISTDKYDRFDLVSYSCMNKPKKRNNHNSKYPITIIDIN